MNPGITQNVAVHITVFSPSTPQQVTKIFLPCCTSTDNDSNFTQLKELGNDHNSSLLLKP